MVSEYFNGLFPGKRRDVAEIIDLVDTKSLSYLGKGALADLASAVAEMEENNVPGIYLETGCALGGSGIVIAAAKSRKRDFYIYDVFGMIPPPSEKDGEDIHSRYRLITEGKSEGIRGDRYYGYQKDLLETVMRNFDLFNLNARRHHVHFVKGLYEHTLMINSPVAFAHIDCDWYDSVMTCLQRIAPNLAQRGVIVVDDYHAWSGCKAAVDDYFSGKADQFVFETKSRLQIRKK
jgi:asparagine synthase (glutamine-hydrolysing)